jgi:hypothetical protein
LDLGRFFSFLIFYTVGRAPWTGDQPVARQLPEHRTAQTQNKRTQTCMPEVGLEPTNPVFKRTKIVHALDRAATLIGCYRKYQHKFTETQMYRTFTQNVNRQIRKINFKLPSTQKKRDG